jgi:hypothetical protein
MYQPNRIPSKHSLIDKTLRSVLYISFSDELIKLRLIEENITIEDIPVLALDHKNEIIACGYDTLKARAQQTPSVNYINPFAHPRVCVHEFNIAEALLRYFVKKLEIQAKQQRRIQRLITRPTIVLHPTRELRGGITDVEVETLQSLGLNLNTKHVYVWLGRELRDNELSTLDFPLNEGQAYYRKDYFRKI